MAMVKNSGKKELSMSTRHWIRAGLLFVVVVPMSQLMADSIWDRRDQRSGYLFMDNKARRVGDTLQVIINENTGANNKEQRNLKKDTAASGKFDFSGSTGSSSAGKSAAASVSADNSSDRSFQGSANYQSNRQLQDAMQLTVIDVLPNGNLVVEGFRDRIVSNEHRLLRVTGVIRPNDIDVTNTVNSQNIADFTIKYEGGGTESRFTNQGWLGRIGNKVWPY